MKAIPTALPLVRSRRVGAGVALIVAAGLLLVPPSARATVYPVATAGELSTALSNAASSVADDRIELAAGTYVGQFTYSGTSAIEIVGAGAAQTKIQTTSGWGLRLADGSASGNRIASLAVEVAGGTTVRGIWVVAPATTIEDVVVTRTGGTGVFGIQIENGDAVIRRTRAEGALSRGFEISAPGAQLTDVSTQLGSSGISLEVDTSTATAVVRRAKLVGGFTGAGATFSGKLTITDSLIDVRGVNNSRGLVAGDNNNPAPNSSELTAERVTIVGDNTTGTAADVFAGSAGSPGEADVMAITLRDSIVAGIATPLLCSEGGTVPQATITVSSTALAPGVSNGCADGPSDPGITTTATTSATPGFVNAAAGDFRLRRTSPLLDLAGQAPLPGLLDLAGNARVVDGDGSGTAVADLGAYEYQRSAPVISSAIADPASAQVSAVIGFLAVATDADPGEQDALTYAWAFDDGAGAAGPAVAKSFTTPGIHTATVTVTDPTGQAAQQQVTVTVGAKPAEPQVPVSLPAPIVPPPPSPPRVDRTAPALSALSAARTIVLGAGLPAPVAPARAQLRFTVSEDATLALRFERRVGRAWKQIPGTVRVKVKAGKRGVRFAGALSTRTRLRPGRYRVTLVATDGNRNSSPPRRATFRLVAPAR